MAGHSVTTDTPYVLESMLHKYYGTCDILVPKAVDGHSEFRILVDGDFAKIVEYMDTYVS